MIGSQDIGDVSLYIHVPFCSKKCPYCHFFVLPDKAVLKEQYLHSLFQEWAMHLPRLKEKRIVSIYFGGGTPSRLDPAEIERIMSWIHSSVSLAPDCEITLEVNPEDAAPASLAQWKLAGINRISFGIQSLDDSELMTLDRQHSAHKGIQAIHEASRAGFTNISIDLMYDLPYQTLSSWKRTLNALQELPITHLSLYNLTLEPHTVFFKRREALTPHLPLPELSLQLLQEALVTLPQLGLEQYEISAFARNKSYSRHNTGYWTSRPFLGLGPSAYSYWEGARFRNVAHLNRYTERLREGHSPVDFQERLTYPHNLTELLAVQLRLVEGVDLKAFEQRHGQLPASVRSSLEQIQVQGWLEKSGDQIQLTEQGRFFYDSVAVALM